MATQVSEAQFSAEGQGHPFQLRAPLAKPTARKCKACSADIFEHACGEVTEADLMRVIDVSADDKASVILEDELLVGGFKAAIAESKRDHSAVVLNCAGEQLHSFLPKTRPAFDMLRREGRAMDVEWEDSSEFADSALDDGEREAKALGVLLDA